MQGSIRLLFEAFDDDEMGDDDSVDYHRKLLTLTPANFTADKLWSSDMTSYGIRSWLRTR